MKLLHIPTNGFSLNGIVCCIAAYMAEMNQTDFQATVLAVNEPSQDVVELMTASGCTVVSLSNRKRNPIKYFFQLYRYLQASKFDLVHVHGSSSIMSIELLAAKWAGCKVRIAHSHNMTCDHIWADKLLRFLFYRLYTHGLACGKAAGDWLFGDRPYVVLPNGRDLEKYSYNEETRICRRQELSIPEDAVVIGHVGAFSKGKNHTFLLDVFREVAGRGHAARLLLVGEGKLLPELQETVQQYGLEGSVIFAGKSDAVERDLCAMDVFVLPSLFEGLPLVLVEAQAAGLPCVVADHLTRECAILDTVQMISLQAGAGAWADGILNLDPSRDRRKGRDDVAAAGYDIRENAKRLEKIYDDVLKQT